MTAAEQQVEDELAEYPGSDEVVESCAVGAMLLAPAAILQRGLELVTSADFSDTRCRFVVGVIEAMSAVAEPVDIVTVAVHVERRGLLGADTPRLSSLRAWLHEAARLAPVPASLTWYCRAVAERAVRQRLHAAAARMADLALAADVADLDGITNDHIAAVRDQQDRLRAVAG